MSRLALILTLCFFTAPVWGQSTTPIFAPSPFQSLSVASASSAPSPDVDSGPDLAPPVLLPIMSADLALNAYHRQSDRQAQLLSGYSASTRIHVELPDSSQRGEFELERHYTAPHTLAFKAIRYEGDGFVKTNVITRLLQSEVDHLQKDDPSSTALRPENYKFSHKSTTQLDGRTVHVFQVKPRKKRTGLFRGQIYLDAHTGSLVRVEGRVVKSPSIFIKKIEFIQDYSDVRGFTLPTHMHSEARASIVGRTVVDIENRDYQPTVASVETNSSASSY